MYIVKSLRTTTHIYSWRPNDDVMRINFRFVQISSFITDILAFYEIQHDRRPPLDLLGESARPPTKTDSWWLSPVKIGHDRLSNVQVDFLKQERIIADK